MESALRYSTHWFTCYSYSNICDLLYCVVLRCCYRAYNLPCFNAIFFKLFLFLRSIFQQFLYFNGRYFQCAYISTTIFQLHEREAGCTLQCCLYAWQCDCSALPAVLCFSYCLTRVYLYNNQKISIFLLYTFTLK
jgi:hypothetical protein